MESLVRDIFLIIFEIGSVLFNFFVENWALLVAIFWRQIRDFLLDFKKFLVAMPHIASETHKILKLHDERITALEDCISRDSQT